MFLSALTLALGAQRGGASAPTATVRPSITGTETTEQVLTAVAPTWSKTPDSVTRQWYIADVVNDAETPIAYDNETPIIGQTGATYTIAISDYQSAILVAYTAMFDGTPVTTFSDAVGPIEYTDILVGIGSFDSATGWSLTGDAAITGGKLQFTSVSGQKLALLGGLNLPLGTYRWVGTVDAISGGPINTRMAGGTGGNRTGSGDVSVTGPFSVDYVNSAGTAASIGLQAPLATVATIDDLNIYRIA